MTRPGGTLAPGRSSRPPESVDACAGTGPEGELRHPAATPAAPLQGRWCAAKRREEPMMSVRTTEAASRGGHRYQLDSGLGELTPAERAARGKEARAAVPRDSHAVFEPGPAGRPDRPARGTGEVPGPGTGAHPPGQDDRLTVRLLPWGGTADGHHLSHTRVCGLADKLRGRPLRNFGIFGSPDGSCCSTSTTSMRRFPARANGTSSGWPPA